MQISCYAVLAMPIRAVFVATMIALALAGLITALNDTASADRLLAFELRR